MEIRHLRYFEAVAQTLSFTTAAERVHVAQSTMSHQIRQLEDEIGQLLFYRDGKNVTLTEAGEVLLAEVVPTLGRLDHLNRLFTNTSQPISGALRVGATQGFTARVIPQCLVTFMQRFPSIQVFIEELSNEAIIQRIADGTLDLGVGYCPLVLSNIWFKPLYHEELMLLVQSNHHYARRRRLQMSELHGLRMVMLPASFSTRKILDECLHAANAEPLVIAEINSLMPMIELIRISDLAGLVAYGAITDHTNLSVIPIENPSPIRTPGLLMRKAGNRESVVEAFSSVVRKTTDEMNLQRLARPAHRDFRKK